MPWLRQSGPPSVVVLLALMPDDQDDHLFRLRGPIQRDVPGGREANDPFATGRAASRLPKRNGDRARICVATMIASCAGSANAGSSIVPA
jgi:hypothetical protein